MKNEKIWKNLIKNYEIKKKILNEKSYGKYGNL